MKQFQAICFNILGSFYLPHPKYWRVTRVHKNGHLDAQNSALQFNFIILLFVDGSQLQNLSIIDMTEVLNNATELSWSHRGARRPNKYEILFFCRYYSSFNFIIYICIRLHISCYLIIYLTYKKCISTHSWKCILMWYYNNEQIKNNKKNWLLHILQLLLIIPAGWTNMIRLVIVHDQDRIRRLMRLGTVRDQDRIRRLIRLGTVRGQNRIRRLIRDLLMIALFSWK